MKQRHHWIISLFAYGTLFGAMFGVMACSTNTTDGPCSADYNCSADKPYCVNRACVATLPGTETVKEGAVSEPGPEPTNDAGGKETVVKEDPPSSKSCSNQKDCSDPTPWCRFGKCSEGYAYFDFTKGHPIVEISQEQPPKACTGHAQCPSWQSCFRTQTGNFCLTPATSGSSVKGKIGDEGIFMSGRSYATVILANAQESLRIVMVGELSDKLQQELHIDVPKSLIQNGAKVDIEKNNIQIRFYEVKIEFVPPIKKLIAVGVRGSISFIQGPTSYSTRNQAATLMAGSADLVLKRP